LCATYKGKKVGSIVETHMFSFFPNKNVTTGEGGMLTTSNDELAEKMRVILNQGQDKRYHHIQLGYNYRMTEIQAAIGIEQLKKLDYVIQEKNRIAAVYNKAFAHTNNVKAPFLPSYVTQHAWYMYAISVKGDRDEIVKKLEEDGIQTRLSFPPIHTQPYYQKRFGYENDSLPVSFKAWSQLINIPIWAGLGREQQKKVINSILELCEN
jgi:perosamine synthetase